MADKTSKKEVAQAPDSTQIVAEEVRSNSEVMGEFMRGVPQYPVFCVNPDWGTDSDEDRWTLILPLDGELQAIRTELRGYTPKSDLSQMALNLLKNPERAIEDVAELPVINDMNAAKLIGIVVQHEA